MSDLKDWAVDVPNKELQPKRAPKQKGFFLNKRGPNRRIRRRHLSTIHPNNRTTTPGRMRQVIPLGNKSVKVLIHRRLTAY